MIDAEWLELLLNRISGDWPRPLEANEREVWARAFQDVDPELAIDVLAMLKHTHDFEFVRPSILAFSSHYQRAFEATKPAPVDPADVPVSPERAAERLAEAREKLKNPVEPDPDPEPAEQLL